MNDIKVGSIVVPENMTSFYNGHHFYYQYAVVVSTDPLVVVSKDGNMRWPRLKKKELTRIGTATRKVFEHCSKRLLK